MPGGRPIINVNIPEVPPLNLVTYFVIQHCLQGWQHYLNTAVQAEALSIHWLTLPWLRLLPHPGLQLVQLASPVVPQQLATSLDNSFFILIHHVLKL